VYSEKFIKKYPYPIFFKIIRKKGKKNSLHFIKKLRGPVCVKGI